MKRASRAPEGGSEKMNDVKNKDDVTYVLQQAGCDVKVTDNVTKSSGVEINELKLNIEKYSNLIKEIKFVPFCRATLR